MGEGREEDGVGTAAASAALCEVQWTQKEQRNLDSFLLRMLHIHDIYRLKNLNYKEDIEAAVKK